MNERPQTELPCCPLGACPQSEPLQRKRRSRPWHRVLGLLAGLPLVWVVITGAVLNHTVDWKLDRIMIDHPWVLSWYGMVPEGEALVVDLGGHQVVEWDGAVFFDGRTVEVPGRLVGAVRDGEALAIVTESHVLRCTVDGEVLEMMDDLSLPTPPLTGVAVDEGQVHLRNADGWFRMSMDWLGMEKREVELAISPPVVLNDEAAKESLRREWSHGGLPFSRVLLDAHAGKFLGSFSRYFYDAVAVATIWLCVTGMILFFRKPRRAR